MTSALDLVLIRVLPIIILLIIGLVLRKIHFFDDSVIDGLKKIIVNMGVPALLFLSFFRLDFDSRYALLTIIIFLLCFGLYFLGPLFTRLMKPKNEFHSYLFTGFEYGMLALALFTAAFGSARVQHIAVVDLGHEVFIWFFYVSMLKIRLGLPAKVGEVTKAVATSPVIIGIVLGVVLNLIGLRGVLENFSISAAALRSIEMLGSLTSPLILLVIGYGLVFEREGLAEAAKTTVVRFAMVLGIFFLMDALVIKRLLDLGPWFSVALFTFLLAPPPFILSIFIPRKQHARSLVIVNNTLMLYTIFSIAAFVVYLFFAQGLTP